MAAILSAMFLMGIFAALAQIVFMREMLAVFYGNELCIGLILGGWFAGISSGAMMAKRSLLLLPDSGRVFRRLRGVCLSAGLLFIIQVCCVRLARQLTGVQEGEYASPLTVGLAAVLFCFPSSSAVGYFFPMACRAASLAGTAPVRYTGTVYFWESAGSALAGVTASLLMVVFLNPFQMTLVAAAIPLAARQFLSRSCMVRSIFLAVIISALSFLCLDTGIIRRIDFSFEQLRFGKTPGEASVGTLVSAANTPYQSLAVTEYAGQKTLYSNGQVLFVFPDRNSSEHRIHFVLAQNPAAANVLLLGGNPFEDAAEILKYRSADVTYVEHDPAVSGIIRGCMPAAYAEVLCNPRFRAVQDDPYTFASAASGRYDIIIVSLPEPSTVSASRYYSVEFYRALKNMLSGAGYVCTVVRSSERLQEDTADMSGSVYKALRSVFPVVYVTAGENNMFFASGEATVLTFDPDTLAGRSSAAGITNEYFRPEYFKATDIIDPEKTAEAERRLLASSSPPNSLTKPSSCFYSMNLWLKYSGSALGPMMRMAGSADLNLLLAGALLAGLASVSAAVMFGKRLPRLSRANYMGILFLTGFCTISAEILLVYVFQSSYGSVYSKIGIIVGVFMLGLMGGSAAGRHYAELSRLRALVMLTFSEFVLIAVGLAVAIILPGRPDQVFLQGEAGIYCLTFAAGLAGGAQFPLVCMLMGSVGGGEGVNSADAVFSDNTGAAIGALTAGVVLVPVLGIGRTSFLIVMLNVLSLMLIASAELVRRSRG